MVNQDIKKFFGRKKDEESCDIYEDKWVTTKSGRELCAWRICGTEQNNKRNNLTYFAKQ
jgi:hypothetical protein